MRRVKIPFLVLLLVVSATTSTGLDASDPACPTHDMPTVEFFVQTLPTQDPFPVRIPIAYLDGWRPMPAGSTQQTILFDIDLRGFLPWEDDHLDHHMGMLVTSHIELSAIVETAARTVSGLWATDRVETRRQPAAYGLEQVVIERVKPGIIRKDIYVASQDVPTGDPTGITDVIECGREGLTPYTSCRHYIDPALGDITFTYRLHQLPDWADIAAQVRAFWNCSTDF